MKKSLSFLLLFTIIICTFGACSRSEESAEKQPISSEVTSSEVVDLPGTQIEEVEIDASLSAESSTILDITSSELFNSLAEEKTPSNVILHLDDELFVVADDGLYVPFEAALSMCQDSMVPVLYVNSKKAANELGKRLNESQFFDCIIMSDKPELVKTVRQLAPKTGGAIDARENKLDDDITYLIPLRNEANQNNAKIILFGSHATAEQVLYLQRRLMTIWVETADQSVKSHCNAFISGANGIVSTDPTGLFEAIDVFEKDTLFREVSIVGHRGQPATNADNTLAGAQAAINAGADAVECDIHLSADMEFVIMHDSEISYYTSGKGKAEQLRTQEIQFYIIKGTKDQHIPKLDEFFNSFRNSDIMHTIELKTSNQNAVYLLRDLIAANGVSHQVNIISFDMNQLKLVREVMPEISCGYLGSLDGVYSDIAPFLNQYNFSYHPVNSRMSQGNAYALNNRGISVNTWTYDNKETLFGDLLNGYASLTTNGSLWASDLVTSIEPQKSYNLELGKPFRFEATAITKTGKKEIVCEPIVVGGDKIAFSKVENDDGKVSKNAGESPGEGVIKISENEFTPDKQGQVEVILKYAELLENGKTVYHYSKSVNVTVK